MEMSKGALPPFSFHIDERRNGVSAITFKRAFLFRYDHARDGMINLPREKYQAIIFWWYDVIIFGKDKIPTCKSFWLFVQVYD